MGVFDPKKISTQDHLDIEDIREDLVVLKSGKVSLVIETTSLNFDLLDSKEKDAKIYSFASFLNSIRFPIQVVIRTQRTDIAKYINLLEDYKNNSSSEDINRQVTIYQDFINNLTEATQILAKRFFTIIPTTRTTEVSTNFFKQMFGQKQKIVNLKQIIEKAKDELYPKRDAIIKQFANMGVSARQLKTDELIKLYYSVYEPDKSGIDVLNIREDDVGAGLITT